MQEDTDVKFNEEELANSKRIFKSATPKYTADWYIKWLSSVIVLAAMSMRGVPELQVYDLILSVVHLLGPSEWGKAFKGSMI